MSNKGDSLTNALSRFLDPIRRRIALMVRRAIISLVNDDNEVQVMQLKMFKGECRSDVERLQEYGLSTVPVKECKVMALCVDGECGHEVVIATDDRRYRPRKQKPGDVMIYTLANRKDDADTEHHVFLGAEDRLIRSRSKTVIIDADDMIELRTKDGKNFLRIGAGYGIRMTEGGGFKQGGSDIRMTDGKIWFYGAEEVNTRTKKKWSEEPPTATSGVRGPTMPE